MWKAPAAMAATATRTPRPTPPLLAKAVGKPVRVQWSRADEHGWDPKGPPTLMDMRASMDAQGNVTAWEGDFFMPQQTPGGFLVPLVAATLAGMPATPMTSRPAMCSRIRRSSTRFPNVKTVCKRLETTPFRPSWIRTPGRMQNTYANECFMDELAAAAKHRSDRVPHEVSRRQARPRAARSAGRRSPSGKSDHRRKNRRAVTWSRAAASHMSNTSWCALISAQWPRSRSTASTGVIRVSKFYVAHDCGQIINPDGLKNQLDGNVIQTVSRTLIEEVKFDRSQVTSLDWVELSDPQISAGAGDGDRSDRPTDGETVGRRRARRCGDPFGNLQRGVRRDRRAVALDTLHASES